MPETLESLENLTLNITQEIHVDAPVEITFAALVEQLSTANEHPDGTPMPMKLELWPGGRWFRDLGGENGHWWGVVQAIKRNTLLEISGPMFMSFPAANNVQYRLSESKGGTLIQFRHSGFGLFPEDFQKNVNVGWAHVHEQARKRAEGKRSSTAR